MLSALENFFSQQPEPIRSCLLFLRVHIKQFDTQISEEWKYGMPFYCVDTKMFCYLWIHKKHGLPYIGFAEGRQLDHPDLIVEKRARMKILLVNPEKDIPLKTINLLLKQALELYKK